MPQPGGAWSLQNGNWVWVPGGTPDPNLASQWGNDALTNPAENPSGDANSGAWLQSGHQWIWVWGAAPDPTLAGKLPPGVLTDPAHAPNGWTVPGDPAHPPPPDVVPPTLGDSWSAVPDVTGQLPPPPGGGSGSGPQTVDQPPSHPAYVVSPGGIRNAEIAIKAESDTQIDDYNNLKAAVAQSDSQNLYTDPGTEEAFHNGMDVVLLQIGDAIELTGQYISMLNYAAQNYAHADIESYLPQS